MLKAISSRRSLTKADSKGDMNEVDMLSSFVTMKQWKLLTELVVENPDIAKLKISVFDNGKQVQRLLIHEACRQKAPSELIEALVAADPESLSIKDEGNGSLPLHFACRYGATPEIIRHLIESYPEATKIEDKYGCPPGTTARRSSYKHKESIVLIFDEIEGTFSAKDS